MKKITFIPIAFLILALTACGLPPKDPISKTDFLLNTYVTVTLYDSRDRDLLEDSLELCRSYEQIFSKTLETSEVYRLNHRPAGQDTFTVSEDLARLLEKGLYYSRLSGGAFDITVDPITSLWNFTDGSHVIPDPEQLEEGAKQVDYQKISLSEDKLTFLSPDTRLDLGAIAKGYIADRMKEYLVENGVTSAVINLGGNILCIGQRPDKTPFKIGLQKPFADRTENVGILNIRDRSVVSSGVYERHFEVDGQNYHHILDPATGYPFQNGLIAVTIVSEESVDGDGLSTACFSLGLEEGMKLLNSMEGVCGVFITEDYELHYSEGMEQLLEK